MKFVMALMLVTLSGPALAASAPPVTIVAAENFYGDIARQIGGDDVRVVSIMNNPSQDPHLFEITPSVARAVSAARIVISSGAGYDPWIGRLLLAARSARRQSIVVADLVGRVAGDNPHIWYETATMSVLANQLATVLSDIDPAHAGAYAQRRAAFALSMRPVQDAIAALRQARTNTPVTATEPVFFYMFAALGMDVRNAVFQVSIMNGTEPGASSIAAFETSLTAHQVQLLVYNSQVTDPMAVRMRRIAGEAGIPVVGAPETEPPDTDYQHWMLAEIGAVARALGVRS